MGGHDFLITAYKAEESGFDLVLCNQIKLWSSVSNTQLK